MKLILDTYDYDFGRNDDDLIDSVFVVISGDLNDNFSSQKAHTGRFGYVNVHLSFRVSCIENFYGSDCGTFCVEHDDVLGHYTCSSEGEIICLDGYQNPFTNCTECIPAVGCCELQLLCMMKHTTSWTSLNFHMYVFFPVCMLRNR